jgi:hypothetical protein
VGRDNLGLSLLFHEVTPRPAIDVGDTLGILYITKERGDGRRQRVRPAVNIVRLTEDLDRRGRRTGVVVAVVGLARR